MELFKSEKTELQSTIEALQLKNRELVRASNDAIELRSEKDKMNLEKEELKRVMNEQIQQNRELGEKK